MGFGRQPGLVIRMRDSETGDLLQGGSLVVVSEDGEDMTCAYSPEYGYFGATYVDGLGRTRNTPFGRYTAHVLEAGRFADSEGPDHALPADVPFTFDEGSAGYVDLFCKPLPSLKEVEEEQEREEARGSLGSLAPLSERQRLHLWYLGVSAIALALCLAWLLPAAFCMLSALLSPVLDGMGMRFGARLLGWFASGYLLEPWEAAVGIASALGPCKTVLASAAISLAGTAWAFLAGYRELGKRLEDKYLVRNPLLDSLPEHAPSAVYGSRGLVRSPSELREELMTYDPASSEPPDQGGLFVGFLDGPIQEVAPRTAAAAVKDALWKARARKAAKGSMFERGDVPPRPEPPSTMRYVCLPEFMNAILLGDTRAGKTRRILLATIDIQTRAGVSPLITDPKGELYALTHELSEERYGKENVVVLNFRDPANSDRHNFMQPLIDAANAGRGGVFRRDSQGRVLGDYAKLSAAANDLVKMLLPDTMDVGNSKYFNQGARSIITSVCCAVASNLLGCPEDQKSLSTVASVIDRYVRPRDLGFNKMYSPYREMLRDFPHDHPAVEAFATAGAAKDMDLASFSTTALTVLQDFRDQGIAQMTSCTDVPPAQLGRKPTVIYLIIPHEKLTYGALASLYLQQAYAGLIDESVRGGNAGSLRTPVMFLCEELGQIPPIPELDKKLTVCLGAGIRWLLVFQSMGQLIDRYEQAPADVIWGNCDYKLLLKTTDTRITGEYVRSQLGEYTCYSENTSRQRGPFSVIARSLGQTQTLAKRDVLLANEVSQWSADVGCLVMTSKKRGPYVVPLPDVSQTPTGELIGINDPKRVAKLYADAYQVSPGEFSEAMSWDPCLGQMDPSRTYTEEEFKEMQRDFLNSLKPGKKAPPEEQEGREESRFDDGAYCYMAFVNWDTGETDGPFKVMNEGEVRELRDRHREEDEWSEIGGTYRRDTGRTDWKPLKSVEAELATAAKRAEAVAADRQANGKTKARRGRHARTGADEGGPFAGPEEGPARPGNAMPV